MVPYYKNRICLNVLANSLDNAKAVYDAAEGHVLVGVLSSNYETVEEAQVDMQRYADILDNNLSIGLGGGNPKQWKMVGDISEYVIANHINQVFTGVGYTFGKTKKPTHINALVSPTDNPRMVKISTGPLSSQAEHEALVDIETAIKMIKDMGGSAVKFFPMGGLKHRASLIEVARACAKEDFCLEPTGGIDFDNFEEILQIILNEGVSKIIPHVYTSIIDPETGATNVEDVKTLLDIVKRNLD